MHTIRALVGSGEWSKAASSSEEKKEYYKTADDREKEMGVHSLADLMAEKWATYDLAEIGTKLSCIFEKIRDESTMNLEDGGRMGNVCLTVYGSDAI